MFMCGQQKCEQQRCGNSSTNARIAVQMRIKIVITNKCENAIYMRELMTCDYEMK